MKENATCYAWGHADGWDAICVDFDLAAQGDSFEEARNELFDAIDTFLSYAAELPESERGRLLNRKAPLGLRWKLAFLYRLSRLSAVLGDGQIRRYAFRPEAAGHPAL